MIKDYMDREEEIVKQPDAKKMFQQIAGQRPEVFRALWSFWNFEHVFDDLLDESTWSSERKEQAYKAMAEFVCELLLNPFFKTYATDMRAMFTSAVMRQIGGDALEARGEHEQASVCRCADIDIMVHIATLANGWDAGVEISRLRDYDKTDKKEIV